MSKSKIWGIVLLVGALIVGVWFYTQNQTDGVSAGSEKQPVATELKLGAIYPLTGPAATFGDAFKRGAELAAERANAEGIKVNLVFEDSKTNPKAGIAAYQKLRSQDIRLMLTTISAIALAIEPVAREDGVLLFADVAYPGITKDKPLLFRHSSTAEQEARVIFNHLVARTPALSTGVMWINDDYGRAFKEEMERLGRQKMEFHFAGYEKAASDLRAETAKLLDANVDTVVVVGYGKAMGLALRRLREAGFKGELIANVGLTLTPDAVATAGGAAEGVLYTHIDIDESNPEYQRFATRYKEKYGTSPPSFAALSYNSAALLIDAARKSGPEPHAIASVILSRKTHEGAGENMVITADGDILPPVSLKRYEKQQND